MYTYIIMLLISLFFAFILEQVRKLESPYMFFKNFKIKKIYIEWGLLFLSMLPFILVSGLRRNIGYDYDMTYVPYFNQVNITGWRPPTTLFYELGYYWLNKVIGLLGGGYVWLFLSTTIIIIVPFWIGFYKQSKSLILSIAMFFCAEMFFLSMDAMRQFMGLAIVFYAFKYVEKNSFLKYAAFVLVGTLFHKSTAMWLPLYFLKYIKLSPIIATTLILLGSMANGLMVKVFHYIVNHSMYANYLGTIYNQSERIFWARAPVYTMMFVVAAVFYYNENNRDNKLYRFMFNILTIITFVAWNANIMPAHDRFCWSLEVILLLLVPFILGSCKDKKVRYALMFTIIVAFSMTTYNELLVVKNQGVVPYVFTFAPDWMFY